MDPDLQRPYQWEFTAGIERQLSNNWAVSFGVFRRKYYDLFATVNVALQPSDYTPVTFTNPLASEPFTVYNQNPSTVGRFDNVLMNSDAISQWYNGLEGTVQRRMSDGFMLFGGITFGANKECSDGAASTNPNQQTNACGYSSFDSQFMANMSGVVELPLGINLSGHVQHSTGQPLQTLFIVTRALVPNLTQVNETVRLLPTGERRKSAWTLLDLRVSKAFRSGSFTIEPLLDLYNILNENAAIREVEQVGPALGRVSENVDGRLIKLGLKLAF
jgi:hypothetical protein